MEQPSRKELWPVMLTPFTASGEVDYDALARMIDWYEEAGTTGLFAICQSSEVFYLSLAERVKIASFVKKRAHVPVIASGHTSYSRCPTSGCFPWRSCPPACRQDVSIS